MQRWERLGNTSKAVDKFAGGNYVEAELWLNQLEMAKDTGNWTNLFLKGVLLEKLIGEARLWHQNHIEEWTTWKAWKARFMKKFMPDEDRSKMHEQFLKSCQQRGESLEMFAARTHRLGKKLGLTTREVKRQILKGLAQEYVHEARFLWWTNHEDIDDLVRDIQTAVELKKEAQHGGNFFQPMKRNFQGTVLICYKCGVEGHKSIACPNRENRHDRSSMFTTSYHGRQQGSRNNSTTTTNSAGSGEQSSGGSRGGTTGNSFQGSSRSHQNRSRAAESGGAGSSAASSSNGGLVVGANVGASGAQWARMPF